MLISVISINYNNKIGLEKTMNSVIGQTYESIEYIVIDGGSTDGSVEVIERNHDHLAYYVSESDGGIYHAQNKGLGKAKGDFVLFLNSGDVLLDNQVLETVVPLLDKDIVYGDIFIVEPGKETWLKKYNKVPTLYYFYNDTLPHQGAFIKRSLFVTWNVQFDENLVISSDWKFFVLAICKWGASYRYLGKPLVYYDYTGISSRLENREILLNERNTILKAEFPQIFADLEYIKSLEKKLKITNKELKAIKSLKFVRGYFKVKRLLKL